MAWSEPQKVLRALWQAEGQELDEDCTPENQKACKNMKDVSFDGFAPAGSDLGQAWRDKLEREGKLSEGSLRDLVLGEPSNANEPRPESVPALTEALREVGYLADRGLATTLHVALQLGRPVLLEGEVGVGKTEVARALSELLDRRLIRLQCYEGIDAQQALYEWDYARQMLQIRALSEHQLTDEDSVDALFGPKFLVERPLLDAVRAGDRAVLLVDEVDRADDEFEAFLLELLSEFQITIPEIGPIRAEQPPLVILTSNRTRELHDALKRRCLYHWVGFPSAEREVEIVLVRAPGVSERLARSVVTAVNRLREMDLAKPPGVAETIDWVNTLGVVGAEDLDHEAVPDTLGAVIKDRDDLELVAGDLDRVISGA